MALQPIADALHLIHGPGLCLGHVWASRPTASSGPTLHRTDVTTDLGETDIVFGAERRLARAIDQAIARHDPAALFVYQTCVPALIGDDVTAVCAAAARRHARPVIPVDLPGLAGVKDQGAREAGEVLLRHLIGTREPAQVTATDVALIGEYGVAGEVAEIGALLARAGMRLAASIPGDGRVGQIAAAHRVRATLSTCSRAFDGLGERMRDCFGIPTLAGSVIGSAATGRALRGLAALLIENGAPPSLGPRVEALIDAEEARLAARLAPLRPRLAGRRALIGCGGVKAWSLAEILTDLGIEVAGTSVGKCSEAERARAGALAGPDRLTQGLDLGRATGERIDLALSGGQSNRRAAARAGIAWVEVNHERRFSLAGYDGVFRLAQAIDRALAHPPPALPAFDPTAAAIVMLRPPAA